MKTATTKIDAGIDGDTAERAQVSWQPLERSHLTAEYLSWLNDPEVTRYMETGTFPTTAEDLERFFRSVTGSREQVAFAIVHKESGKHVGNVKLGPIHWVHRGATLGIMIGDKKFWGQGLGEDATRLAVEYGFY